jgi:hypothetical protein
VRVDAVSDVREELAVELLGNGTFRLLVPPAHTLGLARGDVFEVDAVSERPAVLRHSGNVTVWLYPGRYNQEALLLAPAANGLGGTLEGETAEGRLVIFTFPVRASFAAIEAIFEKFVSDHPQSEWLFGNVYADDGTTPLGWWE